MPFTLSTWGKLQPVREALIEAIMAKISSLGRKPERELINHWCTTAASEKIRDATINYSKSNAELWGKDPAEYLRSVNNAILNAIGEMVNTCHLITIACHPDPDLDYDNHNPVTIDFNEVIANIPPLSDEFLQCCANIGKASENGKVNAIKKLYGPDFLEKNKHLVWPLLIHDKELSEMTRDETLRVAHEIIEAPGRSEYDKKLLKENLAMLQEWGKNNSESPHNDIEKIFKEEIGCTISDYKAKITLSHQSSLSPS